MGKKFVRRLVESRKKEKQTRKRLAESKIENSSTNIAYKKVVELNAHEISLTKNEFF